MKHEELKYTFPNWKCKWREIQGPKKNCTHFPMSLFFGWLSKGTFCLACAWFFYSGGRKYSIEDASHIIII